MGNLGFDSFREQIRLRNGNNATYDSAGAGSTDYYGVWINKAYRQLCAQDKILGVTMRVKFPQLFTSSTATTVDGTAYISTPTGCLYVTEVYDSTNNRKLDQIRWKSYVEYTDRATAASEGKPTEWVRRGDYIYVHPTPDAAYSLAVYYKKLPDDLSGTNTTVIGAEWDDPIVELAAYTMFTWLGEFEKAKYAKAEFVEQAAGLMTLYQQEEKDSNEPWKPSSAYMPRG